MSITMESKQASEFAAIGYWEPEVQAFVDFDAATAQKRATACGGGPLSGWSIGVKDIIDVAGMPTRCNATFMPETRADKNADLVEQLLSAGAFVMAKTVTTSFAYFDPGPTRNPWNRAHTPGGSSSGSAAAVACGMVRLALGTQTVASVNRPASFCGVVGFKPSYGLLPTGGVFPFSPSVDTLGFFTRDVADTQAAIAALFPKLDASAPGPPRIGVVDDLFCEAADPEMISAISAALATLSAAGCATTRVSLPAECRDAYEHHIALISAEAAVVHRDLFERHGGDYSPMLRKLVLEGRAISAERIERVNTHRRALKDQIAASFGEAEYLLVPAAAGAAPKGLERTGDPRFSLLWTYTGCPSITLPAGLSESGLPLGLQLVGLPGSDVGLLAAAKAIESFLDVRIDLPSSGLR